MPPVLVTWGKIQENPPRHILNPRWVRALERPWSLACTRFLHVYAPPPSCVLHRFPESSCSWFIFLGVHFPQGRGVRALPLPGSCSPQNLPPYYLAPLTPSSDCFFLSSSGKGSVHDQIQFPPRFEIWAYGKGNYRSSPRSITGHAPRVTPLVKEEWKTKTQYEICQYRG